MRRRQILLGSCLFCPPIAVGAGSVSAQQPAEFGPRTLRIGIAATPPEPRLRDALLRSVRGWSRPSMPDVPLGTDPRNPEALLSIDLPTQSVDQWFDLHLRWERDVTETLPIFLPAGLAGDQLFEVPPSRKWSADRYTLREVQSELPTFGAPAFRYYFAGRAFVRERRGGYRFTDDAVLGLRIWFLGSFELAKTSNVLGADGELITVLASMAERARESAEFNRVWVDRFWSGNGRLVRDYIRLPSFRRWQSAVPNLQSLGQTR